MSKIIYEIRPFNLQVEMWCAVQKNFQTVYVVQGAPQERKLKLSRFDWLLN